MALECDLKPSTHPISQTIEHTGDAVSTFDAISYKKGASWIKTMDYFLGRPTL
jgi:aminopeptidase N